MHQKDHEQNTLADSRSREPRPGRFFVRKDLSKIRLEGFTLGRMRKTLRYPRIRANLLYIPTRSGQFIVKETNSSRYFKLSQDAVRVMRHLDGLRSPEDLSAALGFKPIAIRYLLKQLDKLRLLDAETRMDAKEVKAEKAAQVVRRWGYRLVMIRKDLITSDKWMDTVYQTLHLRALFQPWSWLVLIAFYISAGIVYLRYHQDIGPAIARLFTQPQYSLTYILIGAFIILITGLLHELAHGFVCKHFGGQIRTFGIGFYFFQPAFYCDVTDAYTFVKRSHRIFTHAAGLLMNLLIASLALLLIPLVRHNFWAMEVIALIFLTSGVYSLFNLNPLIQLDGYYMLIDILGIENMRMKALAILFISIRTLFEKLHLAEPLPALDRMRYTPSEKKFLLVYATLSMLYTVFMLWYLSIRYSELLPAFLGNIRWLLTAILITLLVIFPLWRTFKYIEWQMKNLQAFIRDEQGQPQASDLSSTSREERGNDRNH